MNKKYRLPGLALSVLLTLFSFHAEAASAPSTAVDSIGVENHQGKEVVLHRLAAKESYYSLSRTYAVNPNDIIDRKSTRLNSSHVKISYAVFCLKKKKK